MEDITVISLGLTTRGCLVIDVLRGALNSKWPDNGIPMSSKENIAGLVHEGITLLWGVLLAVSSSIQMVSI